VDPGNIVHATDASGMIVITQLSRSRCCSRFRKTRCPGDAEAAQRGASDGRGVESRQFEKAGHGELERSTTDRQYDGNVAAEGVFANTDNALFPQHFVNIRLLVDTLQNQLTVPGVAVQNGHRGLSFTSWTRIQRCI